MSVALSWSGVTADLAASVCARKSGQEFVEALDPELLVSLQSATRQTFVGIVDGEAVAEADCEFGAENAVWLSVWVDPDWRRQGIGRMAIQHAVAWAAERGAAFVAGGIEPENPASLAMARSAGFAVASDPDGDGLFLAHLEVKTT